MRGNRFFLPAGDDPGTAPVRFIMTEPIDLGCHIEIDPQPVYAVLPQDLCDPVIIELPRCRIPRIHQIIASAGKKIFRMFLHNFRRLIRTIRFQPEKKFCAQLMHFAGNLPQFIGVQLIIKFPIADPGRPFPNMFIRALFMFKPARIDPVNFRGKTMLFYQIQFLKQFLLPFAAPGNEEKRNLRQLPFQRLDHMRRNKPTPEVDRQDLRLREAYKCLLLQKCSVKEAAEMFGFTDEAHFSKTFQKYFRQTPASVLKQKNRGG